MRQLERDVAVFFAGIGVGLVFERDDGGDQARAGIAGLDDGVEAAAFRKPPRRLDKEQFYSWTGDLGVQGT